MKRRTLILFVAGFVLVAAVLAASWVRSTLFLGSAQYTVYSQFIESTLRNCPPTDDVGIEIRTIRSSETLGGAIPDPVSYFRSRLPAVRWSTGRLYALVQSRSFSLERRFGIGNRPYRLSENVLEFKSKLHDRSSYHFFVFSAVAFSVDHSQALFYAERSCGPLCGEGRFVLMVKRDGIWEINGQHLRFVA